MSVDLHAETAYKPTCSAGQPGGDLAIALTLAEPAGLEVEFNQRAQHLRALWMPAPGWRATPTSARARSRTGQQLGRVLRPAAGRYVFIVKAQAGRAGDQPAALGVQQQARESAATIDDDTDGCRLRRSRVLRHRRLPAPACVPDAWRARVGASRTLISIRARRHAVPDVVQPGDGRERVIR